MGRWYVCRWCGGRFEMTVEDRGRRRPHPFCSLGCHTESVRHRHAVVEAATVGAQQGTLSDAEVAGLLRALPLRTPLPLEEVGV